MNRFGAENRRTPRRLFKRLVGLLFKGEYGVSRALQISEGGMLLITDHDFHEKDLLVVSMLFPGGGHAVVRAEVLYRRKETFDDHNAFGVRFLDLTLPSRRLIRHYVANKTQEEAEIERELFG